MDPLHFAYWLRGYTEITNGAQPDATQWQIIQDHLNEVFTKVTPDRHTTSPSVDELMSITGNRIPLCGQKDPTLPQPNATLYRGARQRLQWPLPAGDGVAQLWSSDHTC